MEHYGGSSKKLKIELPYVSAGCFVFFLRLENNLSLKTSQLSFSLSITPGNAARLCPNPILSDWTTALCIATCQFSFAMNNSQLVTKLF